MKYGENLIITGVFECVCLVYLITPAALRSLTRFTTPWYESVICSIYTLDTFVYQTDWSNYTIDWIRFIDDIFLTWNGDYDSLTTFIGYLNGVVPSTKFTHEISFH